MYTGLFAKLFASVSCIVGVIFMFNSAAFSVERQHGAHVHGNATMNLALDGGKLMVELLSPAANIFGFEHLPQNEADEHTVHEATKQLQQAGAIFVLPESAMCKTSGVTVDGEVIDHVMAEHDHDSHAEEDHEGEHHHDDAEEHDEHDDGDGDHEHSHSDITANYEFACSVPEKLNSVDVKLFTLFPGFEKIMVQVIGAKGQTAVTLTPANTQISF